MDFFENQDRARRQTSMLIAYYLLAVVLIIVAVYAAVVAAFLGLASPEPGEAAQASFWHPGLFVGVAVGTLLVVIAGTTYKIHQLAAGGASIATLLGGRRIQADTQDTKERVLLNVVEEVAIASGTVVPAVYLLDEQGINAFAAGLTPDDAVIGVTRGGLSQLTRDELQGVIAHEFSHILNGDMRLNIRLMGVLHGILVIGLIGMWVFRSSFYTAGRSRSRGKDNKLPIVLFGVALMIVGAVGVFFGKIIKSAVSRQREYLADASAVQFTRHPAGIAGALKKIGGWNAGSRLANAHAEEASHLFFCNGVSAWLPGLMATHPPLTQRIRRIDPGFKGEFGGDAAAAPAQGLTVGFAAPPPSAPSSGPAGPVPVDAHAALDSIGAPQKNHIDYAARVLAAAPESMKAAAHDAAGAQALIYALLLDREAGVRAHQIELLVRHADSEICRQAQALAASAAALPVETRLPLTEVAMGALAGLSADQYRGFRDNLQRLIEADERMDLFEYALQRMLRQHLDPSLLGVQRPRERYASLQPLCADAGVLLSTLAHWGAQHEGEAAHAFASARSTLGPEGDDLTFSPAAVCGLSAVDQALDRLAQAAPRVKKQILGACLTCAGDNGWITVEEAELVRVVSDTLGCPMPPLLPGAAPATIGKESAHAKT